MKIAGLCQFAFIGLTALFGQGAATAQISMYTAIDLALRNSTQVRTSVADVQRAQAGVAETVDVYKPSVSVGSSLGYSYGFPIGQPEVFSVTTQSLAFSYSQPDYIRSARKSLESAQLTLKDTRQQVISDTASDYIELAKVEQQITALDQESGYVQKLIEIVDARVDEGRDTKIDLTQARLQGAQVSLRRLQLSDQADLLRARLGHLTGLMPTDIVPEPDTIPPARTPAQNLNSDSVVMSSNVGVQAAYAAAKSKLYMAFGDARRDNRPVISFVATYGLFSNKFNNYSEYYRSFQQNNFGGGVQINIPFLDAATKAKARGSSADAVHAAAQAEQIRNQAGEQVLQLQRSLAELAAQQQVAQLQSELAQDQLAAINTEMQTGSGNPNQAPVTPKDAQEAHIEERNRYVDMLDAQFQLRKAQLDLMRATGAIEDWAKSIPQTKP